MAAGLWDRRRVVVTGHTGFKGAWLSLWLQSLGARVVGIALPPEHDDGVFAALQPWNDVTSHHVDVRDGAAVHGVMADASPEVVFHLAAQAIVGRAHAEPAATFHTNVVGTAHVLDACAQTPSVRSVVVVTTDKVYRPQHGAPAYREDDPLGSTDPYSASKVCCEHVAETWREAYLRDRGVQVATARAGNVIGGGDRGADRLVPDLLAALRGHAVAGIRHPSAVRPWQFVLDPLDGYLALAARLLDGDGPPALNFGPDAADELTVAELADAVVDAWGSGAWRHTGEATYEETPALRVDATLARAQMGWSPRLSVREALQWTVAWERALDDGEDMRAFSLGQLAEFTRRRVA